MIDIEKVKERIKSARELLEAVDLLQDDATKTTLYKAIVDLLVTAAQDLRPALVTEGEDDE